jgi:hypothetical protein
MTVLRLRGLWPAALSIVSASAVAAPDPTLASAPVPSASYTSAFKDYRPLRAESLRPWKTTNDEVARIGGWRAYAREAQQPDAPPARAASAPAPAPARPHH